MTKIHKTGFKETPISIVSGSWQVPRHYERLQRELYYLSYHSIVAELGTDEPSMTLDDNAAQLAMAEKYAGLENPARFAHSSGLNIAFRELDEAKGVIVYAGGVDDSTYKLSTTEGEILPERYSYDFQVGIIWDERNYLTRFRPDLAAQVLYHDCDSETQLWATSLLREKLRSPLEPALGRLAVEKALGCIYNTDDRALNPEYCRALYRLIFNIEPDKLNSGHSGNLSKPKELAELTDAILTREKPIPHINPVPNASIE